MPVWCSGNILALGARDPGIKPPRRPFFFLGGVNADGFDNLLMGPGCFAGSQGLHFWLSKAGYGFAA